MRAFSTAFAILCAVFELGEIGGKGAGRSFRPQCPPLHYSLKKGVSVSADEWNRTTDLARMKRPL